MLNNSTASFTNIVLNAIEAMPTGGELSILCRPVPKALIDFTTSSNGVPLQR